MKTDTKKELTPDDPAVTRDVSGQDLQAETLDLKHVIEKGNKRWRRLVLLEALGLAIAAPLAYLWMIFALDTVLHLSMFGRFLASLVFLAAVIWQARRLLAGWRQARFSDDQVALAIERNTPGGVENRLINSIQLAERHKDGEDLARAAVVHENYQRLKKMRIEQAAQSRPATIRVGLAGLAIVIGFLFYAFQPERFSVAAARILLPFADVSPIYRTRLFVEPGDVQAERGDDVRISVRIEGTVPSRLMVISRSDGERAGVEVPVPPGARRVEYVFSDLKAPLSYAVRGGDYITPYYSIHVPVPPVLQRLRVVYDYPEYTGLPQRVQEGTSGDLQGLFGTEAGFRMFLNRPAESAAIVFWDDGDADAEASDKHERLVLNRDGPSEFSGRLTLDRSRRYRIETQQKALPPTLGRVYDIQVFSDQPPDMHLIGITDGEELTIDAVVALTVVGRDDFGLVEAGVFARTRDDAAWEPLQKWSVDPQSRVFEQDWILPVAGIGAVEGEPVEIAARARDNNPLSAEIWHTGQRYSLTIGGEASRLQIEYERILKAEADLARLIEDVMDIADRTGQWMRRLDPAAGVRWDDGENLRELDTAMSNLAEIQSGLRSAASRIAREMPEDSGSLKISVGMLADTEMVRAIQMIEGVSKRETPQQKRSVLGEARLTQERTTRSLRDILNAYTQFRRDWELENMLPFTQMLAHRQSRMSRESLAYAELPQDAGGERLRSGTSRRQLKLRELTGLTQTAFMGIAEREDVIGKRMAAAFGEAAKTVDSSGLKPMMDTAASHLSTGEWQEAAVPQEQAAAELSAIYDRIRQTQIEVAQEMMKELRALAEDSPDVQAEIEQLKEGYKDRSAFGDFEGTEDIVRMVELTERIKEDMDEKRERLTATPQDKLSDYISSHVSGELMSEEERDFSILDLATSPGGGDRVPKREAFETDDTVEDVEIIKSFEDLVGDLLEGAVALRDDFYSLINLQPQDIEPGAGGSGESEESLSMAGTSAAGHTGNVQPDTVEHGGVSRIGRQGARAHGVAVGDESISRRGRDEAQESSQEVPDVEGMIQETITDDPAEDHSTGVGGRLVDSDLQSTFSIKDAGEWKDDMTDRLRDPQDTYQIVERDSAPLDPEVAERLRAIGSEHEQLIERIKRVKKELDNLYLPTDHLDDAMRDLSANLDRLHEQPDPESFRLQAETLDRLIGAVMVFDRPSAEFQPSLPRQVVIRGEILDEPQGPTLPGYEEIVKRYYERLANP